MPPEEPAGQNPPEGAILDYFLNRGASTVTLDVADSRGDVIRKYSSSDPPERVNPDTLPYPTYWLRPEQNLSSKPGHHRFVWDLHYEPPRGARGEGIEPVGISIGAVYQNTPIGPRGPLVHPGFYTVRLTVDGSVLERRIEVRMDPRVRIQAEDLRLQTDLSMECYRGYHAAQELRELIDEALKDRSAALSVTKRRDWNALRGTGTAGDPEVLYGGIYKIPSSEETVIGLQHKLLYLLNLLQGADARPTSQAVEAVQALRKTLPILEQRWKALR